MGGEQLKALSIHPYYADKILYGEKTIECRTWKTDYRGDILICSTAKKVEGTIPSHALCVVELVDIKPFDRTHLEGACMDVVPYDSYAWILDNVRAIKPIPVKGKLSLWNFDGELEYFEPLDPDDDELDKRYHEVWEPLEYW